MSSVRAALAAVFVLGLIGCGYKNPTQPTVETPTAGVPTRIELNATPGMGADGGSGAISARVFDAFSTGLSGHTVTFSASEGALSAAQAATDTTGMARTTLTGRAGASITIHASVGSVDVKTLIAMQPQQTPGTTPTPPIPNPPVPPPTPPSPGGPPTYAVTFNASPAAVLVGGTATLSAAVIPLFGALPPTAYRWDCNGDADVDAITPNSSHVCGVYPAAGTFTVSVQVIGGSVSAIATTSIVVAPPQEPTPPAVEVELKSNARTVAIGGTLNFTATVKLLLADETVSSLQWDLDGNGSPEFTTIALAKTSAPYNAGGLYTATVTLTTSTGRHASAIVAFVVTN